MNNQTQWFYSTGDKQQGPVTEVHFKSLIQNNVITPDTLVWKEGMAEWLPLSALNIVIETPPPAVAETTDDSYVSDYNEEYEDNPYAAPMTEPSYAPGDIIHEHGVYEGITRLPYFIRTFIASIVFGVLAVFLGFTSGEPSLGLFLLVFIVFAIVIIRFAIQRIRNIGLSAWWLLLLFVPIVSNILSIGLMACPEGFAQERKMDTAGIVIAVIFGLIFIASLFLNVLSVFASFS